MVGDLKKNLVPPLQPVIDLCRNILRANNGTAMRNGQPFSKTIEVKQP